ncbi:MAG: SprT-like domain-containing protein [Candidatus Peribacteraceae bacterium]|nr:SprT-like domain-containing protein [Candidatus Peribacteraceae bacterium]
MTNQLSIEEMKAEVLEMVKLSIEEFKTKVDITVNVPLITYDITGTAAGKYTYNPYSDDSHTLKFNLQIMIDNWDQFRFQTVVHETAHYLTQVWKGIERSRSGKRIIHGKTWKAIMKFLGADDNRCHSYNVDNVRKKRKTRKFLYSCDCMTHQISTVRHYRTVRGETQYRCSKCRSSLTFIEEIR